MLQCQLPFRQFKDTSNGATFEELSEDKYKDLTSTVKGLDSKHTNSIIEIYIKDDTFAGDYQCTGAFQSGQCPEPKKFASGPFKLSVIKAEPTTQPTSGTIVTDNDHILTCIFPDPYGEQDLPTITWYFDSSPILSNGKVYKDTVAILNSKLETDRENSEIKTTLTINSVSVVIFIWLITAYMLSFLIVFPHDIIFKMT